MHAAKHRGVATSYGEPGLGGSGTFEVWPRTRGSDVLAIAAVVDPAVRALPAEPSGHAIEQRWRDCASDLARFAFEQPDREYAQNRTFWATLGATAAYLATFDTPVPAEMRGATHCPRWMISRELSSRSPSFSSPIHDIAVGHSNVLEERRKASLV